MRHAPHICSLSAAVNENSAFNFILVEFQFNPRHAALSCTLMVSCDCTRYELFLTSTQRAHTSANCCWFRNILKNGHTPEWQKIPLKIPDSISWSRSTPNRIACWSWDIPSFKNSYKKKSSTKIPISGCRSGWLPKFNGDFVVQSYISGKNFTKIRSINFMWIC